MSAPKALFIPARLSPTQRRELKVSLGKDLSTEQINLITEVLLDTATIQQLHDDAIKNLTKNETKTETKLLSNNLKSAIKTLKTLPALSEDYLNICYYHANGHKKEDAPPIHVEQFLASTVAMQNAVKLMHEKPLPTNKRTNKFTDSLNSIADRFLEVFPKNKVSPSKASIFYKLIRYWHLLNSSSVCSSRSAMSPRKAPPASPRSLAPPDRPIDPSTSAAH